MNPLSGIYGAASGLRNRLYDRGTLKARRLERPVVSVGNLSVGGAGKTPFVIALGELLKARGVKFDVLSRGYGRKTSGVRVVEMSGTAAKFGDEPLLIARRLGASVVVGESRYEAGRVAEEKFDPQLHILDDGFQHRGLARDFDIVLVRAEDFEDTLLPVGRLREPMGALRRADAVVVAADFAGGDAALGGKTVWKMRRELRVTDVAESVVAFCGIARAEPFFAQVRGAGVTVAAERAFRDHHAYEPKDVEELQATRERAGAGGFVTTEKDVVNLGALAPELTPLAVAELTVTIEDAEGLVNTILERIGRRS